MRPDDDRRRVIPLHGTAVPDLRSELAAEDAPGDGSWHPERIVNEAPAAIRPLIADLLGAMGVPEAELAELRRRLPDQKAAAFSPDEMGAAVSFVRGAVEHASAAGAPAGVTRTRHDCLDAASLAWAESALDNRAVAHRRLLRDVSHDIRSPLNSILFLADALRTGHSGELNDVQKRQVDVLFMAAVTLVKLVNDLIDYAHLDESSEVRVSDAPFSPATVIDDVRSLLGPLLEYHGVSLVVLGDSGLPRRGDAQLLNRVLLNLVSNAIQAMPDGGCVRLEVRDGADGSLEVDVEDDGPGGDCREIEAALEAAAGGETLAETRGWTHGLGLSISARLVAAAGGRLSVEPSEPHGTRFRLSLPFVPL